MTLPDAFNLGAISHSLEMSRRNFTVTWRGAAKAFARAIVHNNDLRLDGVKVGRRSRVIPSTVATRLINRDLTNHVRGARQFNFLGPIEIPQVKEGESTVGKQCSDAALILRAGLGLLLGCRA